MEFKIQLAADQYDDQQKIFIRSIIENVKYTLKQGGLTGQKLKDLTGEVSFSIASLIDNATSIEFEEREIVPVLTFLCENEKLTHCGGNSYTHEYVFEIIEELFENNL